MIMLDTTADSDVTRSLLERITAGDREAVGELFERHRPSLCRAIKQRLGASLRVRADTSDVLQEVELEALKRMDDYLRRQPMPVLVWLLKTTHEQIRLIARQHLQAAKRSVEREVPLPDDSTRQVAALVEEHPSAELRRAESAAEVRWALAQLSEIDREIVALRNFEDLSIQEVAQQLEISPEAARKRYRRALLKLQKLLGDTRCDPH
jgi:RNA polymerase sigma-70 factor (ECF subfamily)